MPPVKWDPDKPWRLEVEFNNSSSYTLPFEFKAAAEAQIKAWLDKGYVTQDLTSDKSKYETAYHPISQIRRFHIFTKESE